MKKKKVIIVLLLAGVFALTGFAVRDKDMETWLCTEENGINHELEYLHELAALEPRKAKEQLGKPVSFAAHFALTAKNVNMAYYGNISQLLVFCVPEERTYLVEIDENAKPDYRPGEILYVHGRITSITPERIMLLNVMGTPGYPNEIRVERTKQGVR